MIHALDVIWIYDELIDPPHSKMVACVEPHEGWFYRINSRPFFKPCLALTRDPLHPWLDHDSYLYIDILFLDDYIVEDAIRRRGIVGSIDRHLVRDIRRYTLNIRSESLADRQKICAALPDQGD